MVLLLADDDRSEALCACDLCQHKFVCEIEPTRLIIKPSAATAARIQAGRSSLALLAKRNRALQQNFLPVHVRHCQA